MEAQGTGLEGLDEIMRGGLRPRALHLLIGMPGTGKTVLAQQISFHFAQQGRNVLYLTALSESVEGLVAHLQGLSFYDPDLVAKRLYYLSIFPELPAGSPDRVMDEIRRLVREHRAELVVLDGLGTLKQAIPNPIAFRRFVFDLNSQLSALGATTLVIAAAPNLDEAMPEAAVADAIILLSQDRHDGRTIRYLEIPKLRGGPQSIGQHSFVITVDGLSVYPRVESMLAIERPPSEPTRYSRAETGMPGLDRLLGGGLPSASSTLISGVAGTGKTVLGLTFLTAGAKRDETGLYVGFHESPEQLIRKADLLALDVGTAVREGKIHLLWDPLLQALPDELVWRIIEKIKTVNAQRVTIDGLDDLASTLLYAERSRTFISMINTLLRAMGITSIVTSVPTGIDALPFALNDSICPYVDNIVFLRYTDIAGHLRRSLSVAKMRSSDFDATVHEYTISRRGMEIARAFDPDQDRTKAAMRPQMRAT